MKYCCYSSCDSTGRHRWLPLLTLLILMVGCRAEQNNPASTTIAEPSASVASLADQYHRLLPLEGGSNFRDLGGYQTIEGKQVVRGKLFRSATMAGLTENDQQYLSQFKFSTVIDLRSAEEMALSPNYWARNQNINWLNHPYSLTQLFSQNSDKTLTSEEIMSSFSMVELYKTLPELLQPQLKLVFQKLQLEEGALVINCSAGQDRTGFVSAMLLSALQVPRHTIIEDYLLSTDYRRVENETKNLQLDAVDEANPVRSMLLHNSGEPRQPKILKDPSGTAYLTYALNEIDTRYGNVENYLQSQIGVSSAALEQLRARYLN